MWTFNWLDVNMNLPKLKDHRATTLRRNDSGSFRVIWLGTYRPVVLKVGSGDP